MPRTILALLLFASCATVQCRDGQITTVYLVRHAEKARVAGGDPALSTTGRARAQALTRALEGVDLDAVYATQFARTLQTVKPAADARSKRIRIVRSGDTGGVVDRVTGEHRGKRVLVAGHSHTIPDLIRALGVGEAVTIDSGDYGDLFVVTITADGATLERRRFEP